MSDILTRIQRHYRTILRLVTIDREDGTDNYNGVFEQAQFLVEDGSDKQVVGRVVLQCQKIREQKAFNDGGGYKNDGTWNIYISNPLLQPSDKISWDKSLRKEFQDQDDFFAYLDEYLQSI